MAELIHLGTTETDPLRKALQDFLDAGRKSRRTYWLGRTAEFLLMLVVIAIVMVLVLGIAALFHAGDALSGCSPSGLEGWNTQPFTDPTANQRRAHLLEAAQLGRTDLLGLCALYLADINPSVRGAAEQAILTLLPQMHSADWAQFSLREREAILKILDRTMPRRTLILLNALERMGDVSVLARVEAFAADLKNREGKSVRVMVAAAEACIRSLRRQQEQSLQARTLLRASQPTPEVRPEILLRPTQHSGSTPAEELLRSTHHDV